MDNAFAHSPLTTVPLDLATHSSAFGVLSHDDLSGYSPLSQDSLLALSDESTDLRLFPVGDLSPPSTVWLSPAGSPMTGAADESFSTQFASTLPSDDQPKPCVEPLAEHDASLDFPLDFAATGQPPALVWDSSNVDKNMASVMNPGELGVSPTVHRVTHHMQAYEPSTGAPFFEFPATFGGSTTSSPHVSRPPRNFSFSSQSAQASNSAASPSACTCSFPHRNDLFPHSPLFRQSSNRGDHPHDHQLSLISQPPSRHTPAALSPHYGSVTPMPQSLASTTSAPSNNAALGVADVQTLLPSTSRPLAPKRSLSMSDSAAHGFGIEQLDGTLKAAISKAPYVRPTYPKKYCPHCSDHPEGFRGEHELRRHMDRAHKTVRKMWVCVNASGDKAFFANCKHCRNGKKYGAYYNAAAHLRRQHFNPRPTRGRGRITKPSERRGGKGGGDFPPMEELKKYMKEVDEVVPLLALPPDEGDNASATTPGGPKTPLSALADFDAEHKPPAHDAFAGPAAHGAKFALFAQAYPQEFYPPLPAYGNVGAHGGPASHALPSAMAPSQGLFDSSMAAPPYPAAYFPSH